MNPAVTPVPTHCPHCGDTRLAFKNKAALWECLTCEERFPGAEPEPGTRRLDDRAARPKAIFFSYGHDENRDLVALFMKDLEKRGHQVWFDEKDIGSWDDWKGRITRGIDASHMAIAFMSRHSIRDPGVCKNEIAIAMNRFGAVYPVLLEAGIEQDIPVTIRHLQWPDLSQWKDIHDGKVPETDWDRWYEEKLINLIEKIESEATRFADETRVLRDVLDPASFEAKIVQHVPGFIGREWLFDAYSDWVDQQPESRLFWIKAGPGVGKSAIAANLAHRQRGAVIASWFCDAKSSELKNPESALKSIAFQLALRWEDYRVKLLRKLQLYASATDETCHEVRKELGKKNTQDLFLHLLAEPLTGLIWREHKLVVVIDALDEATDEQGNNRITEFIGKELSSLPEWICFVVTSRPQADVVNRLHGFKPYEIDAEDPRNLADLRNWYQANLSKRRELCALTDSEQKRIEDLLIERSSGMILYLKVVEEGFREGSLTTATLDELEFGLPGLYRRYYDSFLQRFGSASDYEDAVRPLLRLLLAAGDPLPEDLACEVLGWNSEQWVTGRNRLGSYVIEREDGYELFHKTLADWLTDKASGPFHLDSGIGRQRIADALFHELAVRESWELRWCDPIRQWLPAWLPQLGQYDYPICINALAQTFQYWAEYKTARSLFECAMSITERTHGPEHLDTARVLNNLASLLKEIGDFEAAEPLYRRALAIKEKTLGPEHWGTAITLSNLADLLRDTCDYAAAEPLYRNALAIIENSLGPEDFLTGVCLSGLAKQLQDTGDFAAAEPLCRRALAICEKARGPDHRETGRGSNNLALLLETTGDYAAAEPLYRRALSIFEKIFAPEHPDIALCLTNLAELKLATRNYTAAEPLFRRALAIYEKALAPEHSTTTMVMYSLAAAFVGAGDYAAAKPLLRRALAIYEKTRGTADSMTHRVRDSLYTLSSVTNKCNKYQPTTKGENAMSMRITDVVVEWLEMLEWEERPEVNEEKQTSSTSFVHNVGDDFAVNCFLDTNEEAGFVKLFMYFQDSKIPAAKIDEVIKFVNLANIGITIGHLTVIPDERILRYYTAIDVEEASLEIRHISNMLSAGLRSMKYHLPQFMAICFGGKTAEEALEIEDE